MAIFVRYRHRKRQRHVQSNGLYPKPFFRIWRKCRTFTFQLKLNFIIISFRARHSQGEVYFHQVGGSGRVQLRIRWTNEQSLPVRPSSSTALNFKVFGFIHLYIGSSRRNATTRKMNLILISAFYWNEVTSLPLLIPSSTLNKIFMLSLGAGCWGLVDSGVYIARRSAPVGIINKFPSLTIPQ